MTNVHELISALRCGNPNCACQKNGSNKYTLHCPAHADKTPSLSLTVEKDKILLKDFGGCAQDAIIAKLRERGLWHSRDRKAMPPTRGLTLEQYAEAKKLPVEFLKSLQLSDYKLHERPVVRIPYLDQDGSQLAMRYRLALQGEPRFTWRKGDKASLYGLHRLPQIRRAGWVLLVEGESDCHTLWSCELPALGVPGKSSWRDDWKKYFNNLDVYAWQEPDAQDMTRKIAASIPELRVILAPPGVKDVSEAHVRGVDVRALVETLKSNAVAFSEILRVEQDAKTRALEAQAASVLSHPDPLERVEAELRALGYGGDIKPALIVYLAATSRLLSYRRGSMPVHLLLLAAASSGKSHTINTARQLFNEDAFHEIEAGSPRALIYDQADLRHRVVVFSEADSIPTGEDNPAASAIRNLLQEARLAYSVVVRDEETGEFVTKEINKPGPTVLVTTATRKLGEQLMTRVFTLEISDDADKVRAALQTQAKLETSDAHEPDPALIAFQAYLQARAPLSVVVPFAETLASAIGESITAPRILRDYARLISFIKAIAVIRHRRRRVDAAGRIVAEIEDYATARELVSQVYEDSATGASKRIRQVVEKVKELREQDSQKYVTNNQIEQSLRLAKSATSRCVNSAIRAGWLVNHEPRKGFPAQLDVGEPLPPQGGLPDAEVLRARCSTVPLFQNGSEKVEQSETPILSRDSDDRSTVPNGSEKVEQSETPILSRDSDDRSTVPAISGGSIHTHMSDATQLSKSTARRAKREAWLEHARKWLENNPNHAKWSERMAIYEQKLEQHHTLLDSGI